MAKRTRRAKPEKSAAAVGVSDHAGWAVLITVGPDRAVLDRRRVELVEPGVPVMPHHHEGQRLPIEEAVALVKRVRASAERCAPAILDALPPGITAIALRAQPPLPKTIAERITNYQAMCVADWVMYRDVLAGAAVERGWTVHWYDASAVLEGLETLVQKAGALLGPPWQKDHKVAMAAAIAARKR